eukprot:s1653_g10.t1
MVRLSQRSVSDFQEELTPKLLAIGGGGGQAALHLSEAQEQAMLRQTQELPRSSSFQGSLREELRQLGFGARQKQHQHHKEAHNSANDEAPKHRQAQFGSQLRAVLSKTAHAQVKASSVR